jgi:excisionase family DNA binding protein
MKNPYAMLPQLLTPVEAAQICRVSLRTVRRWIADDELKVHRLGRKVLIAEADLADFLRRCRTSDTA